MEDISDNNPNLDEMQERGWAWLQRSRKLPEGWKHGAPYTDDDYATEAAKRLHEEERDDPDKYSTPPTTELIIVSWKNK